MTVIVVVGGGIMGVSTAYFLAKRKIPVLIIDEKGIAPAASGRAGGFLAKDWCSHYEMDVLAHKGFELHMEFHREFGDICGYRNVDTYSLTVTPGPANNPKGCPSWLKGAVRGCSQIGTKETTAQVHPKRLTDELFRRAQELTEQATKLKLGRVTGLRFNGDKLIGVKVTNVTDNSDELIETNHVILTTGPWSGEALKWLPQGLFPSHGFRGQRAHGVVLKPKSDAEGPIDATCLFMEFQDSRLSCSPEVYPRPDNTVYICGLSDGAPVPPSVNDVEVEAWRCERLQDICSQVIPSLKNCETLVKQACYLPLSPDGIPVIGRIPNLTHVYIATGHACWGILTGPITGRLLAAVVSQDLDRSDQANLEEDKICTKLLSDERFKQFDPGRFCTMSKPAGECRTTKRS